MSNTNAGAVQDTLTHRTASTNDKPITNSTTNPHSDTTATQSKTPYLDALRRDGYVVIPSLIPHHLLVALQATSKYITERARTGKWPHVRTVPKQYPPWPKIQPNDTTIPNIWGIQHLLHPDMSVRDVYAELYFHDNVLNVVKELVGLSPDDPTSDDQLEMELLHLLISPAQSQDFELKWHRDDIRPDISACEETRLLAEKSPDGRQLHAQYNIALFEDDSLIVVPGSHARARTDTERLADPYAATLPDQITVFLNPGDAVFYNSNILHRGVYTGIDTGRELGRMTLHGCVGLAGHGAERARQVLQHAVGEWIGREEARFTALEGRKGERAEGMRKRLIEMGTGEGLGYSLEE